MTAQEFWEFCNRPENAERRLELIRGEVVDLPLPYLKHGVVCATVGALLEEYARRARRGYAVGANAGIILQQPPQSVVGPDIAYFAHTTDELATGWSESLPVLAVDVLSPNEDFGLASVKVEEYVRNGVPYVWLIDYEKRSLTVYRPGHPPTVFNEGSEVVGEGELAELSIRVAVLFQLPGERSTPIVPPA